MLFSVTLGRASQEEGGREGGRGRVHSEGEGSYKRSGAKRNSEIHCSLSSLVCLVKDVRAACEQSSMQVCVYVLEWTCVAEVGGEQTKTESSFLSIDRSACITTRAALPAWHTQKKEQQLWLLRGQAVVAVNRSTQITGHDLHKKAFTNRGSFTTRRRQKEKC